jgi:hypothetical protein
MVILPIFLDSWSMRVLLTSRSTITISIAKVKVYLIIHILFTAIRLVIRVRIFNPFCWFLRLYFGWCARFDLDGGGELLLRRGILFGVPKRHISTILKMVVQHCKAA